MLDRSCEHPESGEPRSETRRSLEDVSTLLLSSEQAEALSAVRAAMMAGTPSAADAIRQLAEPGAWEEAQERVAESQPAAWRVAEPYISAMSAAHRSTWLRINAAPSAAVEVIQKSLLAEVEKSIHRTMAGGRHRAPRSAATHRS